jgi:hypothetical protein
MHGMEELLLRSILSEDDAGSAEEPSLRIASIWLELHLNLELVSRINVCETIKSRYV